MTTWLVLTSLVAASALVAAPRSDRTERTPATARHRPRRLLVEVSLLGMLIVLVASLPDRATALVGFVAIYLVVAVIGRTGARPRTHDETQDPEPDDPSPWSPTRLARYEVGDRELVDARHN